MQGSAPAGSTTGVGRRLLFADDPDPRFLQLVFGLLLALDVGLRAVGGGDISLASWPGRALALTVLTCVAAVALPWDRVPRAWWWVLPVLDVAAVGMARLSEVGGAAAALIVIPAFWLGRLYGRRGALLVLVSALGLMGAPGLVHFGVDATQLPRSVLIPAVAAWGALAIASAFERIETGRREAERRGRELAEALDTIAHQRRFADAILDTVDVGLVLLDRTGAYQAMNRRHRDFMRLAYPDGHAGRAGQLGLVYAADGVTLLVREEMPTYRASNGEEFDDCRIWVGADRLTMRALSVSARSVRDDDGTFAGAALAYKDVTDFMRALRVKDEFLASVSHELRTPLTSIVGYVDLLRETAELRPAQAAQLEVVARNSDRLRRLVADLLHSARAEEGPLDVVRSVSDLSAIVRDAVEAAGPGAKAAGVELESHLPDSLQVTVDAQRMAQVVDNLVSNAIKYTPQGGGVRVALGLDANRVELTVADTGIGIAPRDRERLFTRFFRARQAEEQSIQGVGLGLSIAKTIVESHGGRIEVESEPGCGSVFRVRLPVSTDQPPTVD